MDPSHLRGFLEASGSFSIVLKRTPKGYQAVADFSVKLPAHEADTLQRIQEALGAGHCYLRGREALLKVTKLQDVQRIAHLLGAAPFLSAQKQKEFSDWHRCVRLMATGAHRTTHGLLRIALLRDQMRARQQWNKAGFCFVRKALDPCSVMHDRSDVPGDCHRCHDAGDPRTAAFVPLADLTDAGQGLRPATEAKHG